MNVIDFCIERPVTVTVCVLLALMFGVLAYFATPVQLTPDVIEPEITVETLWPGASAQEVEREIVEEQEEQLKSVEGMREFKSESSDSRGSILMKFEVGTDLGVAAAKVRDKLSQVQQYPVDAREPTIFTVNANANAIAWFILQPLPPTRDDLKNLVADHPELAEPLAGMIDGRDAIRMPILNKLSDQHPSLKTFIQGKNDPAKMRKFAEDVIEARFERVSGIANSNVFGGQEEEFRVVVDPARLAAKAVSITDLQRALAGQNKNSSAGDIWEGKQRNVVRTLGQFETPQQVEDAIIAVRDAAPVRVRDVATVRLDYKKPDGVVRQMGINALAVNAQQAPGTNLIDIMGPTLEELDENHDGEISPVELFNAKSIRGDSLRIALMELNQGVLAQRGLYLEQVYDQTEYLISAKDMVVSNIYTGSALAVLVLLLFLRNWRSVAIIGLSIPISVIATFLFVRGFGRSINVISLAGMAFAVGMVVDNAIVVLENIFRHYEMGKSPLDACKKATQEVWGAVLASTGTTVIAFVPIIFVKGQTGELFRDISIAIACAVSLSMVVALAVIPPLAARILKRDDAEGSDWSTPPRGLGWLFNISGRFLDGFLSSLNFVMRAPGSILMRTLITAGFIVASFVGTWLLMPKIEYLPEGNRNLIIGILLPPPGYNVDRMIEIGQFVEKEIAPLWEAAPGSEEEKKLAGPRIASFFFVARGRMLFMGARTEDSLRAAELIPIMQRAASKEPGIIPIVSQASLFEAALSGGRTIDIEITGPNLETLVAEGQKMFGMCMQEFPMEQGNQLRPIPSLDLSSPELHVRPKWEKAAELGVPATELGYTVNALVDGAYAGDYWHEGTKIDLTIFGSDDYAKHSQDLANLPISTSSGRLVTLSAVADVGLMSGPEQVNHIERQRSITIQIKPRPGIPLEEALAIINEKIRAPMMQTPTFEGGTYQIRLAGTADKLAIAWRDMRWSLLLSLLITYLLMCSLFESYFYPAIIMTSIALALVGGVGGLALLNLYVTHSLDMLTMLGFVILIGTVVNNAILIVHQSLNFMHEEGMEEKAAIIASVKSRIRPILMTTITTVLGMLPLVVPVPTIQDGTIKLVAATGSELYRGLGSVVLGGLIVSTVFTLVLIPVCFSLALDVRKAVRRLFGSTDESPSPTPPPTGHESNGAAWSTNGHGETERSKAARSETTSAH